MAPSPTALDFNRLQAPEANSGVLMEPAPEHVRALLGITSKLVDGCTVSLAGRPLADVRREVRQCVAGVTDDTPVVMTGHQPEFIHPGVWAKHVVVVRLARAVDGVAVNLVADSDAPRSTALVVPSWVDGQLQAQAVPFATVSPGVTYEDIPRLDAEQTAKVVASLRILLGERFDRSMLSAHLAAFGRAAADADYVGQMVAARRAVEQHFDVALIERRVSQCRLCPLLAEILGHAQRFYECYNSALAEYRRMQGISGSQRPVPDLLRQGERFELPLWVSRQGEPRGRLLVESRDAALDLYSGQQQLGSLSLADLRRWDSARDALAGLDGIRFRPRALTLMLWARLLLADLFVHGIGGAKYDRITDLLIRGYFEIEPPPMACASATLRLDLPAGSASPSAKRRLEHQLRDLHYNPQRHLDAQADREMAELIELRWRAVERSRELRGADGGQRSVRRAIFDEIRSLNEQMRARRPQAVRAVQAELNTVEKQLQEQAVAGRRDFFFALFDRASLERLCAALPSVADFRV